MVYRWAQDLLGYHFIILHCSDCMIKDVDIILRRFGPTIVPHIRAACLLSPVDKSERPLAYTPALPDSKTAAACAPHAIIYDPPPIMNTLPLIAMREKDSVEDIAPPPT